MIKPIRKYIFIIPQEEESNKFGIIIPENKEEKLPIIGKIIFIGNQVEFVKEKDIVIFKKYSSDSVKIEDTEYVVVEEDDILAIIE